MNMTNKYQLRHPEWKKRRAEILTRDGYKCSQCKRGVDQVILQVHHRWYVSHRMLWQYPDEALTTLCTGCHIQESQIDRSAKYGCFHEWEKMAGITITARERNPGWALVGAFEKAKQLQGIKQEEAFFLMCEALDNGWITKQTLECWRDQMEAMLAEIKNKRLV